MRFSNPTIMVFCFFFGILLATAKKILYRPYRDGKTIDLDLGYWDINLYRLFLALAMLLALLKNFLYSPFLPLAILLATAKKFCTGHIEIEKLLIWIWGTGA